AGVSALPSQPPGPEAADRSGRAGVRAFGGLARPAASGGGPGGLAAEATAAAPVGAPPRIGLGDGRGAAGARLDPRDVPARSHRAPDHAPVPPTHLNGRGRAATWNDARLPSGRAWMFTLAMRRRTTAGP